MKALTYTAFLFATCFVCAIHTDEGWWYFTAYAQTFIFIYIFALINKHDEKHNQNQNR